jgi:hypothetical protein
METFVGYVLSSSYPHKVSSAVAQNNVLISSNLNPYIADFGLSKVLEEVRGLLPYASNSA